MKGKGLAEWRALCFGNACLEGTRKVQQQHDDNQRNNGAKTYVHAAVSP
jgi:hypothetical protein